MNLTSGLPVSAIVSRVDLVGHQQLDALGPDLVGLAHRDPDVGEEEVAAADRLLDVLGDRDAAARRLRRSPSPCSMSSWLGHSDFGAAMRTSMPSFAPTTR